jgi:hypothetical protein
MTEIQTFVDQLAYVEVGDDDPIDGFDPDAICGATAYTGNRAGQMQCLREPHPDGFVHISACDGRVDYVWRDLRADELPGLVRTSDGVVCRVCNAEATTWPGHFAGCSASVSSAVPGEPTEGGARDA